MSLHDGNPADHLRAIAQKSVEHALALFAADGASVSCVRGDVFEYIAGVGLASGLIGRIRPVDESFTGEVIRSGAPKVFNVEAATVPGDSKAYAQKDRIACGLIAPIEHDGRCIGTVGVASSRADAFTSSDLETLENVSLFVAKELRRRVESEHKARARSWDRLRRLGASLLVGEFARLAAAGDDGLDVALAEIVGVRAGAPGDRAHFLDPAQRPGTQVIAALPASRGEQRIDVRREIDSMVGWLEREIRTLGSLEVVDTDVALPALRAEPGLLCEALLHVGLSVVDRIPAGYPTHFELHVDITVSAAGALVVRFEVEDLPETVRGDATADPFTGQASGLTMARARWCLDALGGSLDVSGVANLTVSVPMQTA